MPAPVCADEDMTAIIAKAIAADPADRWQTPAEMGHALISYMQRNGADDIPLVPPAPEPEPEPEIEEAPAEEETPVEEAADEETPVEEPVEEETPAEEPVEEETPDVEPVEEETPAEEPVEEEAPADDETEAIAADWIDLMDAFLAEEEDGTEPAPDADEPTLRQLLGDEEEYRADAEEVTEEELSDETADILNFANALIEH